MVQVFFVMLFFPVVMNALQYYIIDSFIKDQKPSDHGYISDEDGDEDGNDEPGRIRRRPSQGGDHHGAHDGDTENENTKCGTAINVSESKDKPKLRVEPKELDEYDPAVDGEGSGNRVEPEDLPSRSDGPEAKIQRGHVKES